MKKSVFLKYFFLFSLIVLLLVLLAIILIFNFSFKDNRVTLPGYVDGKLVYIASEYNSLLKKIYVKSGDKVDVNQKLFILEDSPEDMNLDSAKANLEQARQQVNKNIAYLTYAQVNLERKQKLYQKNMISKDDLEIADSTYQQALADKKTLEALLNTRETELAKAKWNFDKKSVNAPYPAIIYDTYYSAGELTTAGRPVLALLSPEEIRVVFFIPEILLSKVKQNDVVDITVDGDETPRKAMISFISTSAEFTPPVIYSDKERSKLVYRIEAIPQNNHEISLLHPGQPVSVIFNNMTKK